MLRNLALQTLILVVFGGIFYIFMSAGGIGWLGQQFPDYKMQITNAVPMAIGIYFIILIIAIFRDVRGKIQKTKVDPSLKREALGEKNYLFEPEISRKVVAKNEEVLLTKRNETEKLEQNAMLGSATNEFKEFTEEKFVEPKNSADPDNDPVLSVLEGFPNAALAIEYRNELAEAWSRVEKLPAELVLEFIIAIETDPKLSVGPLEESIMGKHNSSLSPFESDKLTQSYLEAKSISDEAANEFIKVVEVLGDTLSPEDIIDKIRKKFSTQ